MSELSILPAELLLNIAARLPFVALSNLSATCSRLHAMFDPTVHSRRAKLDKKYKNFYAENNMPSPYHRLLLLILKQRLPPTTVRLLECLQTPGIPEAKPKSGRASWIFTMPAKDRSSIHKAVRESSWIESKDGSPEELTDKILKGDDDIALALLLPMLVNLRVLHTPLESDLAVKVVDRIARSKDSLSPVPLSRLQLVTMPHFEFVCSVPLEEVACYAALPNVRRIVVESARDLTFTWPEGLPQSGAEEVYFPCGSITKSAIRGFAAGFRGPVTMRMTFYDPEDELELGEGLQWDHLFISDTESGRTESLTLKYSKKNVHNVDWLDSGFCPERSSSPGSDCSDEMQLLRSAELLRWKPA